MCFLWMNVLIVPTEKIIWVYSFVCVEKKAALASMFKIWLSVHVLLSKIVTLSNESLASVILES